MELNLKIEGKTREEVLARIVAYLSAAMAQKDLKAQAPGVTVSGGGGGGPP